MAGITTWRNIRIPFPCRKKNEIGRLAHAFWEMSVQVRDIKLNLENIVENRTRELEKANHQLEQLFHHGRIDRPVQSAAISTCIWPRNGKTTSGWNCPSPFSCAISTFSKNTMTPWGIRAGGQVYSGRGRRHPQ